MGQLLIMFGGLFVEIDINLIYFFCVDVNQNLGVWLDYFFKLEGKQWFIVEYYYQVMKFEDESWQEKICLMEMFK